MSDAVRAERRASLSALLAAINWETSMMRSIELTVCRVDVVATCDVGPKLFEKAEDRGRLCRTKCCRGTGSVLRVGARLRLDSVILFMRLSAIGVGLCIACRCHTGIPMYSFGIWGTGVM